MEFKRRIGPIATKICFSAVVIPMLTACGLIEKNVSSHSTLKGIISSCEPLLAPTYYFCGPDLISVEKNPDGSITLDDLTAHTSASAPYSAYGSISFVQTSYSNCSIIFVAKDGELDTIYPSCSTFQRK